MTRWGPNQHFLAVQCVSANSIEGAAVCELVDRHVIAIGPDSKFAIIRKLIVGCLEVVGKVNPAGITVLRDGNTLVVGRRSRAKKRELRDEPTISHAVVEHDGVTIVGFRAYTSKLGEQTADELRRNFGITVLVPNAKASINSLHHVVGPNIKILIGRRDC